MTPKDFCAVNLSLDQDLRKFLMKHRTMRQAYYALLAGAAGPISFEWAAWCLQSKELMDDTCSGISDTAIRLFIDEVLKIHIDGGLQQISDGMFDHSSEDVEFWRPLRNRVYQTPRADKEFMDKTAILMCRAFFIPSVALVGLRALRMVSFRVTRDNASGLFPSQLPDTMFDTDEYNFWIHSYLNYLPATVEYRFREILKEAGNPFPAEKFKQ